MYTRTRTSCTYAMHILRSLAFALHVHLYVCLHMCLFPQHCTCSAGYGVPTCQCKERWSIFGQCFLGHGSHCGARPRGLGLDVAKAQIYTRSPKPQACPNYRESHSTPEAGKPSQESPIFAGALLEVLLIWVPFQSFLRNALASKMLAACSTIVITSGFCKGSSSTTCTLNPEPSISTGFASTADDGNPALP